MARNQRTFWAARPQRIWFIEAGQIQCPGTLFAQQRMGALYQALSDHTVPGPRGPHLLRDDPTLLSVGAAPAGLNFGVRDINNGIRSTAGYTQQRYIDSVVNGVAAASAAWRMSISPGARDDRAKAAIGELTRRRETITSQSICQRSHQGLFQSQNLMVG